MTTNMIKQALVDLEKGLPVKVTFQNKRSFADSARFWIKFNDLRVSQLDAEAVVHRLQRITKLMKINVHNRKDWILVIHKLKWDEQNDCEMKGKQNYTKDGCVDYKIWEKINLHEIHNDLVTLVYECQETESKIKKSCNSQDENKPKDSKFKCGRQGKDATKKAQNTKQIEEEIRNKWTQKLLNENSNGEYNDVVRVLEKNKQLYAHVIRKAAHSLKFKNKYTFGDAIAEIRQRARNHRAPPTSIKNMSGFVVRDSRNSTINTTVLKSVAGVSSSTNDNYNAHTHHMNVNVNNNDNASIKPSYENEEQIISANMSQNGPKSIYKKKKKKKKKKNTNKALPRSKIIIIKMFKKEKNQLNQ
eukprot:548243_1